MIHQSQRRPADPEGKTVLPGTTFKKPEDLFPLLPPQPPRFKPGDEPPGIGDWKLVDMIRQAGRPVTAYGHDVPPPHVEW